MTFADYCVGAASLCYLVACANYIREGNSPYALAYACWATANCALIWAAWRVQ